MRRKYEVYIDGRPVHFVQREHGLDVPPGGMIADANTADVHGWVRRWRDRLDEPSLTIPCADVEASWRHFSSAYRFVQAAGGCVSNERRELLVIERLGRWDLPKGKVEKGEAIDLGAVREVQEECGIEHVELVRPLMETWHTYEREGRAYLKRTDWFLMRSSSTERLVPQSVEDITAVRWMRREELSAFRANTYPALLSVVDAWEEAVA